MYAGTGYIRPPPFACVSGKPGALSAARLTSGSIAAVLPLDIVAGVAVRVVVMDTLLDRVPRTYLGHSGLLL